MLTNFVERSFNLIYSIKFVYYVFDMHMVAAILFVDTKL